MQLSRAYRVTSRLNSGVVWVNCHHRNDPSSVWGGMISSGSAGGAAAASSASGMGRENGLEALHAYTQSRSVAFNLAPLDQRNATEDWFGSVLDKQGEPVRYG